eukprot:14494540-Ditylum_brightwellii.AAC.2
MMCGLEQATKRIVRQHCFYLVENDRVRKVRRAFRAKKKKAMEPRTTVLKYVRVVNIPCNMIELGKWKNDVAGYHDTRDQYTDDILGGTYQFTNLHTVFDCKQDMQQK